MSDTLPTAPDEQPWSDEEVAAMNKLIEELGDAVKRVTTTAESLRGVRLNLADKVDLARIVKDLDNTLLAMAIQFHGNRVVESIVDMTIDHLVGLEFAGLTYRELVSVGAQELAAEN